MAVLSTQMSCGNGRAERPPGRIYLCLACITESNILTPIWKPIRSQNRLHVTNPACWSIAWRSQLQKPWYNRETRWGNWKFSSFSLLEVQTVVQSTNNCLPLLPHTPQPCPVRRDLTCSPSGRCHPAICTGRKPPISGKKRKKKLKGWILLILCMAL